MQDRFRFRIWNGSEMHYNDFVVTATGYIAKLQPLYNVEFDDNNDECEVLSNDEFMINNKDLELDKSAIVMQCTGLKDKNGKLIYEGDVIDVPCGKFLIQYCDKCKSFQCFCKVSWIKELYCFACEGDYNWFDLLDDLEDCDVIGNIYENPELLEG